MHKFLVFINASLECYFIYEVCLYQHVTIGHSLILVLTAGIMKFTSALTVASLTSSTGVINNVYVPDLYKNAWYVDRPVTTAARYFFNDHVTLTVSVHTYTRLMDNFVDVRSEL